MNRDLVAAAAAARLERRRARALEEAARMAQVRAAGAVPAACGPEIAPAPARGPVETFTPVVMIPEGERGWRSVELGYRDRAAARAQDAFDRMMHQAMRAWRKRDGPFTPPFTPAQIGAGRDYRALHERCAAAGIKGSSAFDDKVRGPGRGDFMEAYLADRARLARFHRAIGEGVAKDVKRKAPAKTGRVRIGEGQLRRIERRLITVRALVDAVCLRDEDLSAVLRAHKWSVDGKNRKPLQAALGAALSRCAGI